MTDPAPPFPPEPPAELAHAAELSVYKPAEETSAEPLFQTPGAPVPQEIPPAAARGVAPLGPGLLEALLWILAFFGLEIAGAFVWGTGVAAGQIVSEGRLDPDRLRHGIESTMPWMIGFAKLLEVLAALVAIRLRFGPRAFRLTGFRSVPVLHAVILVFAVLPTAFLAGQCFALFHGYWAQLAEHVPFLNDLDDMSSIKSVQEMAGKTPTLVLVLVIAVLPAMNEEFFFRAAIGRGLLARYGLIAGIALTSMLFAAVHLSPVHAAALLPLAVLMHVGYLSSGSIWWPVALHFCNNALSVVLMKLATTDPNVAGMATDVTESKFSPVLFFASLACVSATVWLLRKVQIRWLLPDGTEWCPAYPSVEPPPAAANAIRLTPLPPTLPLAATAACYALFPVAVIVGALLHQI